MEHADIQLTELVLQYCSVKQNTFTTDETAIEATNADLSVERVVVGSILEGQPVLVELCVKIGANKTDAVHTIEASLLGYFDFNVEGFDEEKVRKWSTTNGYLLLLPFMREVLFSATKLMTTGPYIVPLITLPPIPMP